MLNFIIAGAPGVWQVVLIIALIVLFFGGKKIPELMRGLGKGVGEFKKGMRESGEEEENADEKKKD
jgi:sec-independent protein translocase protein TatA